MKKDKGKMKTVGIVTQALLEKLKKRKITINELISEIHAGNIDLLDVIPLLEGGVDISPKYVDVLVNEYYNSPEMIEYRKNMLTKEKLIAKRKIIQEKKKFDNEVNDVISKEFKKLSITPKPKASSSRHIPDSLVDLLSKVKLQKVEKSVLEKIQDQWLKHIKNMNKIHEEYIPEQKYKHTPQWLLEKQINNKVRKFIPFVREGTTREYPADEKVKKGLARGVKIIFLNEPPKILGKRRRSSNSSVSSKGSVSSNGSKDSKKSNSSSKSFDYTPEDDS